jgi:hypothetical protein
MKLFYDHLILVDEIFIEIDNLTLSEKEKQHAKKLSDDYIHQHVLIHILDVLPKSHHEEFLTRFHKAPFDLDHLRFLEEKTQRDINMDLVVLGKKLKKELLGEIKRHKPR